MAQRGHRRRHIHATCHEIPRDWTVFFFQALWWLTWFGTSAWLSKGIYCAMIALISESMYCCKTTNKLPINLLSHLYAIKHNKVSKSWKTLCYNALEIYQLAPNKNHQTERMQQSLPWFYICTRGIPLQQSYPSQSKWPKKQPKWILPDWQFYL